MYKCPSYYDEDNILQNCECGGCEQMIDKELKPCPFCGAGKQMLYKVSGNDVRGFERPELFCDACKACVYFEDSTSTGVDDERDSQVLNRELIKGWNSRG